MTLVMDSLVLLLGLVFLGFVYSGSGAYKVDLGEKFDDFKWKDKIKSRTETVEKTRDNGGGVDRVTLLSAGWPWPPKERSPLVPSRKKRGKSKKGKDQYRRPAGDRRGEFCHRTSGVLASSTPFKKSFVLTDERSEKAEKSKDKYVYKEIVSPGKVLNKGDVQTAANVNVIQFQSRSTGKVKLKDVSNSKSDLHEAQETLNLWVNAGGNLPPSGRGFNSDATTGFRLDLQGEVVETVRGETRRFYNLQLQNNTKGGLRGESVAHVQIPVELFNAKQGREGIGLITRGGQPLFNPQKSNLADLGGKKYLTSALYKSLESGKSIHIYSFTETLGELDSRSRDGGLRRDAFLSS